MRVWAGIKLPSDTVLQQRAEKMSEVREAAQGGQGVGRLEDDRKVLTLGSLFDGAGTIPFAAKLCGIKICHGGIC